MKKVILLLSLFLLMQNCCFAQNEVTFIYINGSNNNNEKMKKWFFKGVNKLHPKLRAQFEKNPESVDLFLEKGKYKVAQTPTVFFWGDKSKEDLEFVKENLSLMRGISPFISYKIRDFIADCLHDAIWVHKQHNMLPILEDLDVIVKDELKKDNRVLLLGYSAGSFITFEYIFTKLPYINVKEFLNALNIPKEFKAYVDKNPRKDSCFIALAYSGTSIMTSGGRILYNPSFEEFKKDYNRLDEATEKYCVDGSKIMGVVNFASPLALFYSELGDNSYNLNTYNKYFYKYLVEHDIFWLTVNYCDDPLGFPTSKNHTNKEISKYTGLKFTPELGFVYDYSDMISLRTTLGAHTSYWSTADRFSKMVVKAFVEGYRYQYDKNIQNKLIKKQRRED